MYDQAAANTRVVGRLIAELMTALQSKTGAKFAKMHLIGHSLGAHCAGYAGKRILGLGRITGLDPAGPSFEKSGLDDEDANFVDVIHTDGSAIGLGIAQAIGDADFYPNGGSDQPGCREPLELKKFTWAGFFKISKAAIDCSHKRAQAYFTESINSECEFRACPCTDCNECGLTKKCDERGPLGCANMGYHASAKNPGEYYLTTSSSSPFCKP